MIYSAALLALTGIASAAARPALDRLHEVTPKRHNIKSKRKPQ